MMEKDARLSALSAWIGRELLPPASRWLQVERVPFSARAIQARARRALAIGEVDENVCAFATMNTEALMRLCWGSGAAISAWIDPAGTVAQFPYGGHIEWIKANGARLLADKIIAREEQAQVGANAVSSEMMKRGWVRFSGGTIATYPVPNEAQLAAIDGLVRESGDNSGLTVRFFIEGDVVVRGEVPVSDVLRDGAAGTLAKLMQAPPPAGGEVPLGKHRTIKADFGSGQDGPPGWRRQRPAEYFHGDA